MSRIQRLRQRVFPDHWTAMLGQIVVYSFVITVVSGLYLVWFYHPSVQRTTYQGPYVPLRGGDLGDPLHMMFPLHVLVRPVLMVGLLVWHGLRSLRFRPAQFGGPGRPEENVVGLPFKVTAVKSAGLFFVVSGLVVVMGG